MTPSPQRRIYVISPQYPNHHHYSIYELFIPFPWFTIKLKNHVQVENIKHVNSALSDKSLYQPIHIGLLSLTHLVLNNIKGERLKYIWHFIKCAYSGNWLVYEKRHVFEGYFPNTVRHEAFPIRQVLVFADHIPRKRLSLNSSGPHHRATQISVNIGSVMACCRTAPSHCLNQCWLTIGLMILISEQFHKGYAGHQSLN